MSCLDSTFTLTPKSQFYWGGSHNLAELECYGADFWEGNPSDLSTAYSTNRFFFDGTTAADPNVDNTDWSKRRKVPNLYMWADLAALGAAKQLALIFGFEVASGSPNGRVLVYMDNVLLHDQTLAVGDNQFLLELEGVDTPFNLYFIHAGGYWFFKGLSGYVV